MKNKYNFFYILIILALISLDLKGQDNSESEDLTCLMYNASIVNSELLWERSLSVAKIKYESSNSSENLLQLCYAYYGKIGNCLSRNDKDNGEKTAELGLQSAEKLSLDSDYESIANSLLGGFNGMSIAFSPMKGMMLGPKSDRQISKSLSLDPKNAIAWLQKGSSQFNTPKIFGGNVKKSIESFKKSIEYFEEDESKPVWMKLEAMVWLGQAYQYIMDYDNAREVYYAVLKIEPDHQWVLKSLLPATIAKLEGK